MRWVGPSQPQVTRLVLPAESPLHLVATSRTACLRSAWPSDVPAPETSPRRDGHYAQADREIAQVLAAHPDSAETHYVDARLLAAEGKWPLAQAELSRAETLAPAMGFAHPDVLAAFSRQVQGARKVEPPAP